LPEYLRGLRACAARREQAISISFDTNCDATGEWASGVADVLTEVDVFLPNEVEAVAISKSMGGGGAGEGEGEGEGEVHAQYATGVSGAAAAKAELVIAAGRLASAVRTAVVITCGKDGCMLQTRAGATAGQAPRCFGAPRGIHPVDATGAGDAFDAGFVFRWVVCGGSLDEAVAAGSCCGAQCTETVGANSNPPSARSLSQMEARQKEVPPSCV